MQMGEDPFIASLDIIGFHIFNFVLVKLENVPTIHLFFMLARRDGISLFSILLPSLFHHLITNCQETHSFLHSNCDYKVRIAD